MAKVIAIINQKGGVGKTTTAVNLSALLGAMGQRVLMIDLDPQGNTTSGLGMEVDDKSIYEVIMGRMKLTDVMEETEFKNLSIAGSDVRLANAELELVEVEKREYRLKTAVQSVRQDFDFIFIDCPPSLGLLTINALGAADSVLIPIQCEYYALEGVASLMNTISRVKKTIKCAMFYAEAIMLVGFLLFQFLPDKLLGLFSASEAMLAIGKPALRIICFHFLLAGMSIILSSTFQALGNGIYSTIVSLCRQLVVLLPVAYLLSLTGEVQRVWLAFPIAELMSLTLSAIFLRKTLRMAERAMTQSAS